MKSRAPRVFLASAAGTFMTGQTIVIDAERRLVEIVLSGKRLHKIAVITAESE